MRAVAWVVCPTRIGFDCRIPATVDLEKFKAQLDEWTSEEGVSYKLVASTGHKYVQPRHSLDFCNGCEFVGCVACS